MENPRFTRVRAVLDTQFDECSTLSSVVRAKTVEVTEESAVPSEQFLVSDMGDVSRVALEEKQIVPSIWSLHVEDAENGNMQAQFAFMRDVNTVTGLLSPKLLAIFDNDIAVPIASFDKRLGKQCAHAQIGQEMREDNIVATNKDKRQEELEAILAILEDRMWTVEQRASLVTVIQEEIERCRLEFEQARDLSYVRYLFDLLHKSKLASSQEFIILGDKVGESTRRELNYTFVDSPISMEKNQGLPRIIIAQDVREAKFAERFSKARRRTARQLGGISIMAVSRGNVAIDMFGVSGNGVAYGLDEDSRHPQMRAARSFFDAMPKLNEELSMRKYALDNQGSGVLGEYHKKDFQNAERAIYREKSHLLTSFGALEKFDRLLGRNRGEANAILAVAAERIKSDQHDAVALIPPDTEFSGPHDETAVEVKFTQRAHNAVGVVCHVKPASTDMEPVETYNETIFLDKPNDNERSMQNYGEIYRLLKLMGLIK